MSGPSRERGRFWLGAGLAATSAMGFASKGIFAKLLYAEGWGADTVIEMRSFAAVPILGAWALWAVGWRALLRPPRAALLGAIAAGCICYYYGALLDFRALALIDASVERVLLFSYPSMVVLLHAAIYRRRPDAAVLGALVLTYAGILMVVTGLDGSVLHGNLAGAGLVLGCAFTYALYYLAGDRWTAAVGSVAFTFYAMAAAATCLAIHRWSAAAPGAPIWTPRTIPLAVALVLLATVIPMLAMAEGVRRIGAPRASVITTVGPPTTILLGAGLLGEHLAPTQWLGVALIVAGVLALELGRRPALQAGRDPD
jgi:drug/metabolite transporter (DMT)-like permease